MKHVVMLEDSPGRVYTVERVLASTDLELILLETAPAFAAWLPTAHDVALITLDHHLGPRSAGSGMDAALALAETPPICPVILHSSDSIGARNMEEVLASTGWQTERFVFREQAWTEAFTRLVLDPS